MAKDLRSLSKTFGKSHGLREWRRKFRAHLARHGLQGIVEAAVSDGCRQSEIEELLFAAVDLNSPGKVFKVELGRYRNESRKFLTEAEGIVRQVSLINAHIIPESYGQQSFPVRLNSSEINVPLEYFDYLPEVIRSYSQFVEAMLKIELPMREIDDRGPELMIIATYLSRVKKARRPYEILANLLFEAQICVGRKPHQSADAVRKIIERYRRKHRHVCRKINQFVLEYFGGNNVATRPKSRGFCSYVLEGLRDPTILLYTKSSTRH